MIYMMTMSGYYAPRPHSSSNRDGAQRRPDPGTGTDNDDSDRRYRRTASWKWESNNYHGNGSDNKPVRNEEREGEDHPPATSTAAAAAEVDADFGPIVPAAKKRLTSESEHRYSLQSQSHAYAYHPHPHPYHQIHEHDQNSSYLQGQGPWNEERSASAFVSMMPGVYKDNEAEPATSTATSFGEPGNRKRRPSESWNQNPMEQSEQGSDLYSDTSIQNPYPYLPHHYHPFQVFPPPSNQHHEQPTLESNRAWDIADRSSIPVPEGQRQQLQRSPLRHSHPTQKQEHQHQGYPPHPPSSPSRHQFGNEYFMSPERPRLSPIRLMQLKDPPPAASAVDTSEMKVKESNDDNDNDDGGDGVEDSAELPPPLPNLQVEGAAAALTRTTNKATTTSSRNQSIWDRKFNELLEYKQQHGHTDVPQTYAPNPSLGLWVNKQRMEHKNRDDGNISTLTDERLERLQSIGFRWAKRRGQVRWDEKYNELLQYAAKFGNCHVPTKFKDNTALGRWVSTQRAEYKKFCNGQKSSLNDEKIRRLDSIGFAWFMAL